MNPGAARPTEAAPAPAAAARPRRAARRQGGPADLGGSERTLLLRRGAQIRTSLNGILGLGSLLLDTELTEEQRAYLGMLRASGRALAAALDDVLDLAALEAGELRPSPMPFRLRPLLTETLRALAFEERGLGVELVCDVDPAVPDALIGDARRLRQVCRNLVANALRATARGSVAMTVSMEAPSEGVVLVRFAVEDTGRGMDARSRARLRAGDLAAEGTGGLGLPISARLVAMLGGRLDVKSRLGAGTQVTFQLPFAPARAEAVDDRRPDPDLAGREVLLAIDPPRGRQALARLLGAWGLRVIDLGETADLVERLRGDARPGGASHPILLDAGSGAGSLHLAAALAAERAVVGSRVIAFSERPRREEATRAGRLGLAALLARPAGESELRDALRRALDLPALPAPASVPAAPPPAPLAILVAEDNAVNGLVVSRLLESRGHEVVLVGDGREAVRAVEDRAFDAVLMDLAMPQMDGLEATRRIRRLEVGSGRRTPIIAITAEPVERVADACAEAGLDACLGKPLEPSAVVEALMRLVAVP